MICNRPYRLGVAPSLAMVGQQVSVLLHLNGGELRSFGWVAEETEEVY